MKRLLPLILLTFGCTFSRAAMPTPFPTATTVQSLPPTAERLMSSVPTLPPTATDTPAPTAIAVQPTATDAPPTQTPTLMPTDDPTCSPSAANPAQHHVEATVDYAAKTVQVQQQITFTNQTDTPLERVVLNVEPNRWLDVFTLDALTVAGDEGFYTLTGRRMEVIPPRIIEPNCTLDMTLDFTLQMPPIIGGVEAFRGYFGYSPRQINLGHWLPTVVPHQNGGWLHHETILIGEQLVLDWADWDVTITLSNAPDNTLIAAPGSVTQITPTSSRYVHRNGREFAASISPVFSVNERVTDEGVAVEVYAMPDAVIWREKEQQWLDGGAYAAKVTAESVALYAEKFGAYPHERLVMVQGDFPDGMEFSGFGFVSTDWFTRWEGGPQSYLMLITVHEVAHQWWYDLVGNDQANAPWLDEALATYSEYIYIEAYYPEIADWWWWFRVNRLNPEGYVNSSVYEFQAIRPYINAVYLRGVLMLHDVRTILGDEAFYAWLRGYVEANTGRVVVPGDLWAQLSPEQLDATAVIRTAFLREPGMQPVVATSQPGNQNRHRGGGE